MGGSVWDRYSYTHVHRFVNIFGTQKAFFLVHVIDKIFGYSILIYLFL